MVKFHTVEVTIKQLVDQEMDDLEKSLRVIS